ncbi:MAG: hypothetical protein EHM60_05885 [Lysobacterales bacterium]|nr:MAG: hypothetical protein EHM60_05885 [Xanthomonadales bacterium]
MLDWIVVMGLAAAVDVQAVSNCAALADDRARLACYDELFPPRAAASPARAATSTSTSAAPGTSSAAAVPAAVAGAAAGVAAAVPPAPIAAAAPEAPARASGATVEPIAPAPAAAAQAASPASQEETFGLTPEQQQRRKPEKPPEIESVESRVTAVKPLQYDRFRLTLENGQVWSQTEPTPRQRFYPGDTITIRKAALGSYMATGPKSSGGIRVRREQ